MGWYVHIHVAFEVMCNPAMQGAHEGKRMEDLAKEHIERLDNAPFETEQFLESIADGSSIHCGHKGDLCTWGVVGNYTRPQEVLEALKPFFRDCYQRGHIMSDDKVEDVDRVVMFWEEEQSERAHCLVYGVTEDGVEFTEEHELPFCWGQ